MKPTLEQIREAQLWYFQDSVFLTLDEARDKWLTMIPQWVVTERELFHVSKSGSTQPPDCDAKHHCL